METVLNRQYWTEDAKRFVVVNGQIDKVNHLNLFATAEKKHE